MSAKSRSIGGSVFRLCTENFRTTFWIKNSNSATTRDRILLMPNLHNAVFVLSIFSSVPACLQHALCWSSPPPLDREHALSMRIPHNFSTGYCFLSMIRAVRLWAVIKSRRVAMKHKELPSLSIRAIFELGLTSDERPSTCLKSKICAESFFRWSVSAVSASVSSFSLLLKMNVKNCQNFLFFRRAVSLSSLVLFDYQHLLSLPTKRTRVLLPKLRPRRSPLNFRSTKFALSAGITGLQDSI